MEIESTPVSISVLAARNGLNGQTLRKQYKEKISRYRSWDQLEHAEEYILYPENLGTDMSLDETCLSNGNVYTILTNKVRPEKLKNGERNKNVSFLFGGMKHFCYLCTVKNDKVIF